MKKLRLFIFLALVTMLTLLALSGCQNEDAVASISLKDHDPSTAIETEVGAFDYNAYPLVVVYKSGTTEQIALTEEMIEETDLFKLYQVGEHDISVNYGDIRYTFRVSVKRNTFEELTFPENNVFTYNGKAHTVEVDGDIPANATVTYIGGNSFVNVGTYDVIAVVSCEGYVTQKLSATVKIEKAKYDMSGVKFEGKEVVYDGKSHSVAISGMLPEGVSSPTYQINGKAGSSATEVGEYTVKAMFENNDPNYESIPEMEAVLKITPAEYTVKGIDIVFKSESGNVISGQTKIYDGKSVTFDLNDYDKLSKKITVSFVVYDKDGKVISTSNKKTNILDVGVYTARVEFTMSEGNNYKPISPIERSFEVLKSAHPSLDNIRFEASQFSYDTNPHSIAVEGQIPGISVSYEYYKNGELLVDAEGEPVQSVVEAGRYTVKAIFTHKDPNREEIPPLSAILSITPANFNVSGLGIQFIGSDVYDGGEKSVIVTGSMPDELNAVAVYSRNGEVLENADGTYVSSVVEPGEYYVYIQFYSTSNNYVISGMLGYAFTIRKAVIDPENIEREGGSEFTYNGEAQIPSIKNGTLPSHVNVTEQLFSVDPSGNRTAVESAVNVGNYVKVITVTLEDSTRYQLSDSGVIEWAFKIIPRPIDVSGINIGSVNLTYNGSNLLPELKGVPTRLDYVSTLYTVDGTEPITEAVNAGQYRLEVELSQDDPNYTLITDTLRFDFVITPFEIDINEILSVKNYERSENNEDLRSKPFENLDPKIEHCIEKSEVSNIEVETENGWIEVTSVIYEGHYRITYNIIVKEIYRNNVTLAFGGSTTHVVTADCEIYIA